MTDETGYLMLDEVIAKIGYTKKGEPQEETGEQPEEKAEDSKTASLLGDGQEDKPQEEKKGRKKSNLS